MGKTQRGLWPGVCAGVPLTEVGRAVIRPTVQVTFSQVALPRQDLNGEYKGVKPRQRDVNHATDATNVCPAPGPSWALWANFPPTKSVLLKLWGQQMRGWNYQRQCHGVCPGETPVVRKPPHLSCSQGSKGPANPWHQHRFLPWSQTQRPAHTLQGLVRQVVCWQTTALSRCLALLLCFT